MPEVDDTGNPPSPVSAPQGAEMATASGPVTFTLDLEDHRPDDSVPSRYEQVMARALPFLEERNVIGTVFVVGRLAAASPGLIREVAAAGHEIALHSWAHVHLTEQTPAEFAEETRRGKDLLEDLAGQEVVGFRAPTFSLVSASQWAVDVLTEQGFTYSSSVLGAANPLYGALLLAERSRRVPCATAARRSRSRAVLGRHLLAGAPVAGRGGRAPTGSVRARAVDLRASV